MNKKLIIALLSISVVGFVGACIKRIAPNSNNAHSPVTANIESGEIQEPRLMTSNLGDEDPFSEDRIDLFQAEDSKEGSPKQIAVFSGPPGRIPESVAESFDWLDPAEGETKEETEQAGTYDGG